MEINKLHSNAISSYKKVSSAVSKSSKSSTGIRNNKDKVEFNLDSSFAAAKANAACSVDAEASLDRIQQLQQKYAGDNCPVSSADIAERILNG